MAEHNCKEQYRNELREQILHIFKELTKLPGQYKSDDLADEEINAIEFGAMGALSFVRGFLLEGLADTDPEQVLEVLDASSEKIALEIVERSCGAYHAIMVEGA